MVFQMQLKACNEKEKNWIGFCQYRKHWISKRNSQELNTVSELNKILLEVAFLRFVLIRKLKCKQSFHNIIFISPL